MNIQYALIVSRNELSHRILQLSVTSQIQQIKDRPIPLSIVMQKLIENAINE